MEIKDLLKMDMGTCIEWLIDNQYDFKLNPAKTISKITKKESEIAATMLDNFSDILANRCCNDFEWPCNWTHEEKTEFTKEFHDWNGDPEEYEQGDILNSDFSVANFLSSKLDKEG